MVETVPEAGKYPSAVKKISKFDVGYVIETEVKGNAAGMIVLVGIDNDGKVTGVKVLANAETPSFWSSVSSVVTGKDGKYNGQTPDTLAPEIVSNATNSSNGVYSAVKASLDAFVIAGGGEVEKEPEYVPPQSQREDSELLALADTLVGGGADFEDVTPKNTEFVRRIYRDKNDNGYVAYLVTIKEYDGSVNTETLIHVGNNGKIVAVEKLTWKTSPHIESDYGSYTPPTPEQVDALYAQLTGRSSTTIDAVELITGSTQNSSALTGSIKEALLAIDELIVKYTEPDYTARIIGISILAAALVVSVAAAIVIKKKRGGKNG
jgi:Na+-translocating ferredoxin:NAD+ oxidoreductase RnfG subunit